MVGAHREVSHFWSCAVVCYTLSSLASCATDVLTGQTHHETIRWLLLRLVALIFAVNFLSVAVQCRGLIGPSGILPLQATLSELEENLAYRDRKGLRTPSSSRLMLRWTVLVWRAAGESNVRGAAWCGSALAFGVAAAPLCTRGLRLRATRCSTSAGTRTSAGLAPLLRARTRSQRRSRARGRRAS